MLQGTHRQVGQLGQGYTVRLGSKWLGPGSLHPSIHPFIIIISSLTHPSFIYHPSIHPLIQYSLIHYLCIHHPFIHYPSVYPSIIYSFIHPFTHLQYIQASFPPFIQLAGIYWVPTACQGADEATEVRAVTGPSHSVLLESPAPRVNP